MKKEIVIIILCILAFNIFANIVSAEDNILPVNDSLVQNIQKGQEKADQFNAAQSKSDYLKQEWAKLLSNSTSGKILVKAGEIVSPPLTLVTGVKADVSWKFFIALALFFTFLAIFVDALSFSSFSSGVSWVIGIALTIIMGIIKVFDLASTFLVSIITSIYGKIAIIVLALAIIMLAGIISKKLKEKREKEKVEEDKTKLHQEREKAEKFSEALDYSI